MLLGVEVPLAAGYQGAGKGAKKKASKGKGGAAAAAYGNSTTQGLDAGSSSSGRGCDQECGSSNGEYVCLESTRMHGLLVYLMQPQGPFMSKVFYLCLMLNSCISEWHLTMIRNSSTSSKGSGGSKVAAEGVHVVSGAPAAAAAAGCSVSGAGDVPRYLAQMVKEGLPAAVVAGLEEIGSKWGIEIGLEGRLLVGEEKQKQFIKDVVGMVQVLMAAVPLPVGCNNPGCGNLEGASEAAKAYMCCTRCRIAMYCDAACQKDHWEAHSIVCKKVKRELKNQEAGTAALEGGSK